MGNPFELHPAETGDQSIRDSKEHEPRVEALEQSIEADELSVKASSPITSAQAHKISLRLLQIPPALDLLKTLIGEKLVRKERITRMDALVEQSEEGKAVYGSSSEHLADLANKNFLFFTLVQDGDDLAITFAKADGETALRPLDNEVLAKILNKIKKILPDAFQDIDEETSGESAR